MPNVTLYTTSTCFYCARAIKLLAAKKIVFTEIRVDDNPLLREEMKTKSNRHTVPQIFINGQAIGGCDDLYALEETGQLDNLLKDSEKND